MALTQRSMALAFKALGDENRIQILMLLQSGEKCACKLLDALNISQPTLSHHMKILCDCGLVKGRKEGRWMHYSICPQGSRLLREELDSLLTVTPDCQTESTCGPCRPE